MPEAWELFVLLGGLFVLGLVVWAVWAVIRSAVASGVKKARDE
jgi:hypothetical protein